jgi:hypothetical protein
MIVETLKHKFWVFYYALKACKIILIRAFLHDNSKFSKQEILYFKTFTKELKNTEYGSLEYTECLKKLAPALKHHYSVNRHHPEFHASFEHMNLFDRIELVCDWLASSKRTKNGNPLQSVWTNKKRYNLSIENTLMLISTELKLLQNIDD